MPSGNEEPAEKITGWRIAELTFGSGVVLWIVSSAIGAIWWASETDFSIKDLRGDISQLHTQMDALDNVSLGNRITALETQVRGFGDQQDKIERKIDRLLERQSRTP